MRRNLGVLCAGILSNYHIALSAQAPKHEGLGTENNSDYSTWDPQGHYLVLGPFGQSRICSVQAVQGEQPMRASACGTRPWGVVCAFYMGFCGAFESLSLRRSPPKTFGFHRSLQFGGWGGERKIFAPKFLHSWRLRKPPI